MEIEDRTREEWERIHQFHISKNGLLRLRKNIIRPVAEGLAAEGTPFRGILYTGLMLTENGPKVIEFNVRFGDPEAQVILPLLENDLAEVLLAVAEKRLHEIDLSWKPGASVCVIAAAPGYPGPPIKGLPISLPKNFSSRKTNFSCRHSVTE